MIDDIQKHLNEIMTGFNNAGKRDFEGYSPSEMDKIIRFPFEANCPVKLNEVVEEDYDKIPMLNLIIYLAEIIEKKGELKLTQKGNLPVKIVHEIHALGFFHEFYNLIDPSRIKVKREADSLTASMGRIMIELSRIVKKRHNKLSLTKTGKEILKNKAATLHWLLLTFTGRLNWAYFDGYGDHAIGQMGFAFSMILMKKYGNTKRLYEFYAKKYFKAFPAMEAIDLETYLMNNLEHKMACFSFRVFERFLYIFGLAEIERVGEKYPPIKFVTKTALFDRLIYIAPPQNAPS